MLLQPFSQTQYYHGNFCVTDITRKKFQYFSEILKKTCFLDMVIIIYTNNTNNTPYLNSFKTIGHTQMTVSMLSKQLPGCKGLI